MPAPPCRSFGDVNGDGVIDNTDVKMVSDFLAGGIGLTSEQKKRADVDGDGMVTVTDQWAIVDYINGTISTFPVCHYYELLEWVRTHYDTITVDCYIDHDEFTVAQTDYVDGKITMKQFGAVNDAYNDHTNLCETTPTTHDISFIIPAGATITVI